MSRKKREKTEPKILLYLATHNEGNKWEIARDLRKSYSNVHGAMKKLLNHKLIYTTSKRKSEKNPFMDVEYYGLSLSGLLVSLCEEEIWNQIDSVAKKHPDKLLVFKKWQFFSQENLKEIIIENLKLAMELNLRMRLSMDVFFHKPIEIKNMSAFLAVFDSMVLGCYPFVYSGARDERTLKIIKVCKRDPELRSFLEDRLKFFKEEAEKNWVCTQEAERVWDSLEG